MPQKKADKGISYEERVNLALDALQTKQVPSLRAAAALYEVSASTLSYRRRDHVAQRDSQINNRKLTPTEEQVLLQRIISMDERGLPPTLPFVRRMADLLLRERVPDASVGKHWVSRFVDRHDVVVSKFLRKYDCQRAQCEDPVLLRAWFERVQATVQKFGIVQEDIYNFDETGFNMGIIATTKVVTQTRQPKSRKGRPKATQPGNRNFVTVIEGINATGWALPATIIFEGKVHQSSWYRTGIPKDWVIGLSENGWTNDEIGVRWLREVFDRHTRSRTVATYRLLLLDGHGSHLTPEFDDFCRRNQIVWLCPPPHSTHLTQACDVGCFSVLKTAYGRLVQEKAELGINSIDKPDFIQIFQKARTVALSEKNIRNSFQAVGIAPFNPETVLSRIRARTPSPLPQPQLEATKRQLPFQTPRNIVELDTQIKALQEHRTKASHDQTSPTDEALHHLVKGCQLAMHGTILLAEENDRLRTENSRQKKKRQMRRSYVAHGGVLTAAEGLQLAEEKEKRKGRSRAESRASQRLCSKCRLPGHDRRKCPENQESNEDSIQRSIHVIF